MMAGGAAAVVGGVLLTLFNRNSTLEQASPTPAPPRNDAWLRSPTWREERALPRNAPGTPLLQLTF